jgi:hypothetical protein
MKLLYACILGLFVSTVSVFAQDEQSGGDHQPPSADQIVSMMQSKLSLTQDQVTAVTPIIEKYTSKREELRQSIQDGSADKDSIRGQMKQLKTDESQELSQVLSADQLSQWQQMMSQHRHKQQDNDGGSEGGNNSEDGSHGGGE